jgi:hypothetical protein
MFHGNGKQSLTQVVRENADLKASLLQFRPSYFAQRLNALDENSIFCASAWPQAGRNVDRTLAVTFAERPLATAPPAWSISR